MANLSPKVAASRDFMEAYARLPKAQKKNVWKFVERFQKDPTAAAINYESIHNMRDKNVRTVRIDQTYRAVVIHPPKGDVYLLVWVDHHDEAMEWAENKVFSIHPQLGGIQILDVSELQVAPDMIASLPTATPLAIEKVLPRAAGLFGTFSDEDLGWAGVPAILLPAVRAVASETELEKLRSYLPPEAYEGLIWLVAGGTLSELLADRELRVTPTPVVDTEDFAAALARPESRRCFVEITGPEELKAILAAPLDHWRVFLHPSQDRLVTKSLSGPARVMGGAGTGKTVVLMHRARHLVRHAFTDPTEKVLITTFTTSLVDGIRRNLKTLCPEELDTRIEVMNLHKWAVKCLKQHGIKVKFAESHEVASAWKKAVNAAGSELGFSVDFYVSEWKNVVRGQAIADRSAYLHSSRVGRRVALTRAQRSAVWAVFEAFRKALSDRGVMEYDDVFERAEALVQAAGAPPYRAVLIDEGQDFGALAYKLIRALAPEAPNDLFIVGDGHQRIYGQRVVLSRLGIQVRGRSSTLRINYRTTEQIRNWAVAVFSGVTPDDLDGGCQDFKGYTSACQGPPPDVRLFRSAADERAYVVEYLKELLVTAAPGDVCLAMRRRDALAWYTEALSEAGITVAEAKQGEGIVLDTMHAVKGLEFKHVVLAGVTAAEFPGEQGDSEADQERLSEDRGLVYVAATRARDSLLVTAFGAPSPLIGMISEPKPTAV